MARGVQELQNGAPKHEEQSSWVKAGGVDNVAGEDVGIIHWCSMAI